eukprot:gene26388-17482_t
MLKTALSTRRAFSATPASRSATPAAARRWRQSAQRSETKSCAAPQMKRQDMCRPSGRQAGYVPSLRPTGRICAAPQTKRQVMADKWWNKNSAENMKDVGNIQELVDELVRKGGRAMGQGARGVGEAGARGAGPG